MPPKRARGPAIPPKAGSSGAKAVKKYSSLKQPTSSKREMERSASSDSQSEPSTHTGHGPIRRFSVVVRGDKTLCGNTAVVHPTVCKALQIQPYSVVRVEGGASVVFVELQISPGASKGIIYLNELTASLLSVESVSVSTLDDGPLPSLSSVTISATIEEQKTETIIDPSPSSEVEWKSMFRSKFRHRVLFKGMIEQFRWCSRQVTVAVEGVHSSADDVAYGIMTDGTCILTGEGGAPNQSDTRAIADGSIRSQKHLLVLGDRGCGKSYFLKKEAERDASNRNVYSINVEELPQGENSSVSTATVLHELLQKAKRSTPCTLVVDDLHLICNTKSSTAPWITAQLASSICDLLEDVRSGHLDIRLIASAVDRESLDPRLTSAENLGLCVTQLIPPATVQERVECMLHCFHDLQVEVTPEMRDEMERVAVNCHAFTPRDFFRLADTAVIHAVTECGSAKSVAPACITDAARKIRPSSLRQFDVSIPTVSWNDIGGSEEAKTVLRDVVSWCLGKQRWIFETFPISPPKGVLLYGPPGCSKTMLAKALAHESQLNFISIKGPEVFSKWVGDSEKAVRDIFTRARNAAPCIVFIDELDGMCGHRGGGGVSDRVISQFLTELDGLPSAFAGKSNALVFVAATNRPDSIDAAVLRPGRIDRCVYIGLPSTSERCAIVRIHFSRIPVDDTLTPEYVAEQTEGYTGAEVVAVVKEASLVAVSEEEDAQFLSRKHVDTALKKVRPRIKPEDVRWYKNWSTRK